MTSPEKPKLQAYPRALYIILAIFAVMVVSRLSVDSVSRISSPSDKTLEEYLRDVQPRTMAKLSVNEQDALIAKQVQVAQVILKIEKESLKDSKRFVYMKRYNAYIPASQYKRLNRVFHERGTSLEEAGVREVRDVHGKVIQDTRLKEPCMTMIPVADAFERANAKYYKRTGRQLRVGACWRSENRQLASKTLAVISCTGEDMSEGNIKRCMRATSKKVASPNTSAHRAPYAFDVNNWKSGRKELGQEGFVCGCQSKIGRWDKNHCVLAAKQGSNWNWALCKMGI